MSPLTLLLQNIIKYIILWFMNYVTRARVTTRHYINTQRIEELQKKSRKWFDRRKNMTGFSHADDWRGKLLRIPGREYTIILYYIDYRRYQWRNNWDGKRSICAPWNFFGGHRYYFVHLKFFTKLRHWNILNTGTQRGPRSPNLYHGLCYSVTRTRVITATLFFVGQS